MDNNKNNLNEHEHGPECNHGEDCNHDHDHEEMIIEIELEDGSNLECEILGTFEVEENEYMVLLPKEEEEVILFKYEEDEENEEFELTPIEDEEEFEIASKAYYEIFSQEQEEDEGI